MNVPDAVNARVYFHALTNNNLLGRSRKNWSNRATGTRIPQSCVIRIRGGMGCPRRDKTMGYYDYRVINGAKSHWFFKRKISAARDNRLLVELKPTVICELPVELKARVREVLKYWCLQARCRIVRSWKHTHRSLSLESTNYDATLMIPMNGVIESMTPRAGKKAGSYTSRN